MEKAGDFDAMPKKEALRHSRELEKLQRNLGGIRGLDRLPDAIFVIDTKKEHIAVTEANKLGLPIVAVVDTNCDPDVITHVIPGNDDAIRSGALLCRVVADAVTEGRFIAQNRPAPATAAPATPPARRPLPRPAPAAAGRTCSGRRGRGCTRRGPGRAGPAEPPAAPRTGRRGSCRRHRPPRPLPPTRPPPRLLPNPPPRLRRRHLRPRRSDRVRIHRQGRPEAASADRCRACSTPSAASRRTTATWTGPSPGCASRAWPARPSAPTVRHPRARSPSAPPTTSPPSSSSARRRTSWPSPTEFVAFVNELADLVAAKGEDAVGRAGRRARLA